MPSYSAGAHLSLCSLWRMAPGAAGVCGDAGAGVRPRRHPVQPAGGAPVGDGRAVGAAPRRSRLCGVSGLCLLISKNRLQEDVVCLAK